MGRIQLALDRVHWRALVKTAMNLLSPKEAEMSLISECLFVSQEGFHSVELLSYV